MYIYCYVVVCECLCISILFNIIFEVLILSKVVMYLIYICSLLCLLSNIKNIGC